MLKATLPVKREYVVEMRATPLQVSVGKMPNTYAIDSTHMNSIALQHAAIYPGAPQKALASIIYQKQKASGSRSTFGVFQPAMVVGNHPYGLVLKQEKEESKLNKQSRWGGSKQRKKNPAAASAASSSSPYFASSSQAVLGTQVALNSDNEDDADDDGAIDLSEIGQGAGRRKTSTY